MLLVVADRYDDGLDLSARRDRFTCSDFSYKIAADEKSGTVLLLPDRRTLTVSEVAVDYARIRVFDEKGSLQGAMTCAPEGRVTWSRPVYR
jgi:hypothetical protein